MSFFPDVPIGYATQIVPKAFKRVTVMKDHSFVIHKDTSSLVYTGFLFCIHLVPQDKTDIENFYTTNEDISFSFANPHDGQTYNLNFAGAPVFVREPREATEMYTCTIPIIGSG